MLSLKGSKRLYFAFGLLLMPLLLMTACSNKKESSMISSELVTEQSGFGSDTSEQGDLVEAKNFDAEPFYPISTIITSNYNGIWLQEINVEAGQQVKEGDLLVTIQPITAETLAKKEAAIDKNKQEMDKVLNGYLSSIETFRQNIAESSGTQKELYELQLKKVQTQYDWYLQNGNREQERMKAELEKLKTLQEDLNIYAPYDGIIDQIGNIQGQVELTTSTEILTMHSEEQIMLNISNGGELRYNQEVTVETGSGENIKTYKGTVISADNVKSDAFKSGAAIVRIDEDIPVEELSNVRVKANIKELHDVLVVRNYAIGTEKEKNYVSILDGDKIMKRRVVTGGSCGEHTWILQGMTSGQSVMIQ